jgi:hypothetical protein
MGKLMVVVGGQFGSEAKGACAAALAARSNSPLVIRTGGPNAGHTVWREEIEYKLRQLPTAAVSNPTARIALAAGSVVDPELLAKEMAETGWGPLRFVHVDEAATVLEPRHLDQEAQDAGLHNWSTQKGIGAARADRIMRKAKIWRDQYFPGTAVSDVGQRNHRSGPGIRPGAAHQLLPQDHVGRLPRNRRPGRCRIVAVVGVLHHGGGTGNLGGHAPVPDSGCG